MAHLPPKASVPSPPVNLPHVFHSSYNSLLAALPMYQSNFCRAFALQFPLPGMFFCHLLMLSLPNLSFQEEVGGVQKRGLLAQGLNKFS